jgi:lysozyme
VRSMGHAPASCFLFRVRVVMRSTALSILIFASVALAACTTGSGVDALQISKPSREITSSVVRPEPVVPVAGPVAIAASDTIEQVSEAGMTALADPDDAKAEGLQQVAMLMPPTPAGAPDGARRVYRSRFKDAKPVSFGRVTPQHHAVHGVDVSRWQGDIDWETLRGQGANFAFIKATDGGDHLDPMFMQNWNGAHRAGLKRGAYHFFYWCRTAADQADWFIRNVPRVKGALPPVIDVEFNHQSDCKRRWSREDVLQKMKVFMDRLERHYGQRPIIYTAPDFYEAYLRGAFRDYPFWLRSVAAHPSKRYPDRNWVFWQYSGSGLSQGVGGRIDLNVFRGDEAAWWKWVGKAGG